MVKSPCKIVFMGTPSFAVPALEALLAQHGQYTIVGVVTQPDRPGGRGRTLAPSPVKACALHHNIAVFQPMRLKTIETHERLAAFGADLFVVAAYGRILPQTLLDLPSAGCINIHASLLPKWRGASPIAHALWHGDAEVGVSIMQMQAALDEGPVYGAASCQPAPEETCDELTGRLALLGARQLVALLPEILAGRCRPAPQDPSQASFAPPLDKAHGRLSWQAPADELARKIRAFDPWPGTYTFVQDPTGKTAGRRINVLQGQAELCADGPVGCVSAVTKKGVLVRCKTGGLWLLRVKPEGRAAMSAVAWAAGRGITLADKFEVFSL